MLPCKHENDGHCNLFGTQCSGIVYPHRAPKKDSPEKPELEKGGDAS